MQMAVLSAEAGSTAYMLEKVLAGPVSSDITKINNSFIQDLSYCIGARNDKTQVKHFLSLLENPALQMNKRLSSSVTGFLNGVEKSGKASPELLKKIKVLKTGLKNINGQTIEELHKLFDNA
jgi:hypothetical protein